MANWLCKPCSGTLYFKPYSPETNRCNRWANGSKKQEIKKLNPDKYILKNWSAKIISNIKEKIEKIEEKLYGNRYETPMQKLGFKEASELVAKIGAGDLYKDDEGNMAEELSKLLKKVV